MLTSCRRIQVRVPEVHEGIRRFLARCTVPLVHQDTGFVHGTGTLFCIDGEALLVTARHVAAEFLDCGPLVPVDGANVKLLGTLALPDRQKPDVAILHIRKELAAQLKSRSTSTSS